MKSGTKDLRIASVFEQKLWLYLLMKKAGKWMLLHLKKKSGLMGVCIQEAILLSMFKIGIFFSFKMK